MRKAPSSDMMGTSILGRLTSAMKSSTSTSNFKQTFSSSTSMGNANSSDFFIRMALDMLQNSKESRRSEPLKAAIRTAMNALDNAETQQAPISIFKPFQIACESGNAELATIAIDCMGKLFTYNYWGRVSEEFEPTMKDGFQASNSNNLAGGSDEQQDDDNDNDGTKDMISFVISTICNAFAGESTDEKVQLQIIKALQAALSTTNSAYTLHGAILLKAIRTTYNVFLLSKSQDVQTVAQGTVTQMIQSVFSRVPRPPGSQSPVTQHRKSGLSSSSSKDFSDRSKQLSTKPPTSRVPDSVDLLAGSESVDVTVTVTCDESSLQELSSNPTISVYSSTPDISKKSPNLTGSHTRKETATITDNVLPSTPFGNQSLKDAFKVLRTLCILSMKPIPSQEGSMDLRSQPVRSKLLALHLINAVLGSHTYVFSTISSIAFNSKDLNKEVDPMTFTEAVKEFLILSLSRNATSVILPVFEVSMEIFGKLMLHSRAGLKREISVFFTEIIIPILDSKKNIPWYQRYTLLKCLQKIFGDSNAEGGRMLVEIYLNYDCDLEATAKENIWERLISALAKIASQPIDGSTQPPLTPLFTSCYVNVIPGSAPALTTNNLVALSRDQVRDIYSAVGDTRELKKRGLELISRGILGPLVKWCQLRTEKLQQNLDDQDKKKSNDTDDGLFGVGGLRLITEGDEEKQMSRIGSIRAEDDPTAFENLKHRKQVMIEGIKRFNSKPKKGMQFLLDSNCISTRTPRDIARFLLTAEGLSKGMIGEFLGEGDDENIAIMHAFVDEMEFTNLGFVEALRTFLQSFRLPGESQKIDRFMLKFAERYLKGNPKAFSSADTAYVLAYSVIMLNTDQHNAQVKRKMTKADFLKNNRGIDEGKDLSINVLEQIFDEINANEIVMKDEVEKVAGSGGGDDNQDTLNQPMRKLKIDQAGINLSLKTEAMFGIITRGSDKLDGSPVSPAHTNLSITNDSSSPTDSIFISATQFENVKPMFQLLWMSILMAISTPLQQSDNIDIIEVSLEGFKSATHLSCLFDLEFEKRAFLSSLTKFTVLGNISEIKSKHLEAAKLLFRIALADGNSMGEYWGNIVRCVSQLENLQLLGTQDSDDMTFRTPYDVRKDTSKPTAMQRIGDAITAAEIASQTMALSVDRIFTASAKLSGSAILDFVRALCESSWDEIKSSSDREHPRMYCLQRLVEISYYNMRRIRVEWSNIWAILGKHINQVGCHSNATVAYFALDKFRQLAMKFLELEELPNFKFQKDFLRPFEEIFRNNPDVKIKDMCLVCLQQMVNAKSKNLMSGWKAMFSTFCRAAQEKHESIVMLAFEVVKSISINHLDLVIRNYTFGDYVNCLVEFCKNQDFPKICLQSVELLHQAIVHVEKRLEAMSPNQLAFSTGENLSDVVEHAMQLLSTPILPKPEMQVHIEQTTLADNPSIRFWFPVLFGLYEVVMTCDLEVRTRALNFLFDALDEHGNSFSQDFWSLIYKGVLLPIFDDLRITRSDQSKFSNREDMSVWLSTTLILALRKFVKLFSNHYLALFFMFNEIVDLLLICMTQESETLSKIGSTCLQEFIEENATKFDADSWDKICDRLVYLCEFTMPDELFFDINEVVKQPLSVTTDKAPHSDSDTIPIHPPQLLQQSPLPIEKEPQRPLCATGRPYSHKPVKSEFQRIIFKCVLHLQVIQTLQELLSTDHNPTVYNSLQSYQVLKLVDCLFQSYKFAKLFNADGELRTMLFRMGFMKQPPNLLKQETLSISGYFMALFCMFGDMSKERISSHDQIKQRLIPLAYDVLCYYNTLDPESRKRNISAWRPVVQIILNGLSRFTDSQFSEHIWQFYHPVVGLIQFDMPFEARQTIRTILVRGGIVFGANATSAASSTYTDIPHLMTIKKTDSVIESATMTTTPTHDKPFQASSSMQSSSADMQTSCDDACVLVTDPANISSNLLAEQTIHE